MITNDKNNKRGDIVDFKKSERFSLSVFRRKQQKLVDMGFKVDLDLNTQDYSCPDCGTTQVSMTYSRDLVAFTFDFCPQCWTVCELSAVYENDSVPVNQQELETMFALLDVEQLQLVKHVIETMIAFNNA